jgi:hypothetical protein
MSPAALLPLAAMVHFESDRKSAEDRLGELLMRSLGRCARYGNGTWEGPRPAKSLAPPQGCYRPFPIGEALDWSKVAALLTP